MEKLGLGKDKEITNETEKEATSPPHNI
jgi:hypothetical protein